MLGTDSALTQTVERMTLTVSLMARLGTPVPLMVTYFVLAPSLVCVITTLCGPTTVGLNRTQTGTESIVPVLPCDSA